MNKAELRAQFQALLNRSDCDATLADTFIEQSIRRIQRLLRIPPMERQQVYAISNETPSILLPADFLEIIDIYHGEMPLTRIPMTQMVLMKSTEEIGVPRYFAREQETFRIFPSPSSGTIKLNYYGEFAEMVDETDEISLGIYAPDLIIYGALSYATDYFLDERAAIFEGRFNTFAAEVQAQADDAEMVGTVQAVRPIAHYID